MESTQSTFDDLLIHSRGIYYGVRVGCGQAPAVGTTLGNSFHNCDSCDWVELDTELDGSCCFDVQGFDAEEAISMALSYWPDSEWAALLSSKEIGDASKDGGLPEQTAILLKSPTVLAVRRF